MVDYSKWDKFAADLSDDDDDYRPNKPVVTKIDKPGGGKIQIGPQGATLIDDESSCVLRMRQKDDNGTSGALATNQSTNRALTSTTAAKANYSDFTRNGDSLEGRYMWCQDRNDVVIRTLVQLELKACEIDLQLNLENRLTVRIRGSHHIILEGYLQNLIETNPTDTGDSIVDWELKSLNGDQYLEIVLKKKSPIPGVVMWWKNVFRGDREIDVTAIEGRLGSSAATRDAWQQAHEMFLSRVPQMQPVPVEIDVADEQSSDEDDVFESTKVGLKVDDTVVASSSDAVGDLVLSDVDGVDDHNEGAIEVGRS